MYTSPLLKLVHSKDQLKKTRYSLWSFIINIGNKFNKKKKKIKKKKILKAVFHLDSFNRLATTSFGK